MRVLADYLEELGVSVDAFARTLAIDAGDLKNMLAGEAMVDYALARRIADVTGGSVSIPDLIGGADGVSDLRDRAVSGDNEIDADALEKILADMLPALVGGASRKGDEFLPRLAADAAARAYAALSSVTTLRNPDRLVQALQPVVEEILEELSVASSRRTLSGPLVREAAERYLRTAAPRR